HPAEPRVALRLADRKWLVAEAQPGVSAALAVRRRAAPVLDEKERQSFRRARQVVLGIDAAQHRIGRNARVETLDQESERGLATGELEDGTVEVVFDRRHG